MEPVEINAGAYYLRQLRADDRLDDRPALIPAFADPEMRRYVPQYTIDTLEQAGEYVASRAAEWADGLRCSWAIAEPTSGRLLGEVGLKNLDLTAATGEVAVWVH
ncbi:MAG: GNAT family N-acetyltransferase, partial [Haloechinothrix sp.]